MQRGEIKGPASVLRTSSPRGEDCGLGVLWLRAALGAAAAPSADGMGLTDDGLNLYSQNSFFRQSRWATWQYVH